MTNYAAAIQAAACQVKGQDFMATGGGSGGEGGISAAAMAALDTVRRGDRVLAGHAGTLMSAPRRGGLGEVRISLRVLVREIAVDGLDRRSVLRRHGLDVAHSNNTALTQMKAALRRAADLLSSVTQGSVARTLA